jgi:hypothetical protein
MGQHLVWAARENVARGCLSSRWPPRPGDRRPAERQRQAEAQRVDCVRIVHWMRSALAHVPKGQQTMVAAALRQAFLQPDQESARRAWRQVADQLRPRWPKLGALMDESEHEVLAYMSFPAQHRAKLHSTDELDKGFVRCGRSGGRVPERPPRVWRRHAPTGSRRSSTVRGSVPSRRPKLARSSGLGGAMLPPHGRPRGEQRGRGWKPRRVA